MKKLISILSIFAVILTFTACVGNDGKVTTNNNSSTSETQNGVVTAKGEVYFLNFKPA